MWSEMITEITITRENKASYEDICSKLSQSPRIFECGYGLKSDKNEDKEATTLTIPQDTIEQSEKPIENHDKPIEIPDKPIENHDKPIATPDKPIENHDKPIATPDNPIIQEEIVVESNVKAGIDVRALQKELIRALNFSDVSDIGPGKAVACVALCGDGTADKLTDDVVLRVCKKVEKKNIGMVALVGKILLLPKLYHLTSKLTTPVMDCLKQLLEVHAAVVIDSCLLPLLSLLPSLQEHHKDIIQHLAPLCAPRLATLLLSTYSERLDTDLPIFQLLCECADFRATETHTAALAVLTRLAPQHHTSTKFGQCLLSVLRRYGPHLQEIKGFRFVVNSHASSLRKLVEMQMKKLEKIK